MTAKEAFDMLYGITRGSWIDLQEAIVNIINKVSFQFTELPFTEKIWLQNLPKQMPH